MILEGDVDLVAYARGFEPLVVRRGQDVLRADHVYLEPAGRALLLESLAVEAGRKLPFYVRIALHDRGSATVRIDPMTAVERSPGVRDLVAWVARDLLDSSANSRVIRTNLELPPERATART